MVYVPGVLKLSTTALVPVQLLKFGLAPPKSPDTTVKPVDGEIVYRIFDDALHVNPEVAFPVVVLPVVPVLVRFTLVFTHTIGAETEKFASGALLNVMAGELAHDVLHALVATT
jgi:hypothetical protein